MRNEVNLPEGAPIRRLSADIPFFATMMLGGGGYLTAQFTHPLVIRALEEGASFLNNPNALVISAVALIGPAAIASGYHYVRYALTANSQPGQENLGPAIEEIKKTRKLMDEMSTILAQTQDKTR